MSDNQKDIQVRRDRLAMEHYDMLYEDLCWRRQDTIDTLIKAEDNQAAGVGG